MAFRIPFPRSIRARLVALVLGVALPLVALIAYDYSVRLATRVELAGDSARNLAGTVAAALAQLIEGERTMLAALAARPSQRIDRPTVCDPLIAEIMTLSPYRANITVTAVSGEPVCSAVPLPAVGPLSVIDLEYAQRIRRTGEFTVGEPFKGRITGRWVVPLVFPRRDAGERLIGWVGSPLDAERIGDLLARGRADRDDVIAVISPQGRIVARSADGAKWVGSDIRGQPNASAMLDGRLTGWRSVGIDGTARIWGVADVPLAGWKVVVGLDEAIVLAPANAALARNSLLIAPILLLAAVLSFGIGRAIADPIHALARTVRRIAAGERGLRAPLTGATEMDRISLELNHMLDALDLSEAENARAIAAQRASDETLRLFVDFAPSAIAMFDREMRYIAFSRRWIEDYHLGDRDIIGRSHYEIFPDLPERWKEVHRRCLAGAVERADEDPFPRADGSVDWVRWAVHPWRTADGAIGGIILFSEVITERVRAEAERRAASARFEKLFLGAPEAISISEFDSGRFLEVNAAFCRMFDYSREALLGRSALELDLWSSPERRDMVIDKLRAGERVQSMAGRARTRSGEFRDTLFSADRIDFGGMPCLLLMFIDITERKRADEALAVSRARLEAMTRRLLEVQETERRAIARELHDEVGGALTAVKLNLQALRRAHTADQGEAALLDGLALVDGAIRSVRSLSLDLRPAVLDDLGLIPALKWYGERQAQRSGVAIELALDAIDLKAVPQLESACFRIVQEAVTNALRHAGAQHIRIALRRDDNRLAIEVADDGDGFDVAAARRRGLAGETGGLLGMEERAGLLGGRLSVDSAPGAGACVRAEFVKPEGGFA